MFLNQIKRNYRKELEADEIRRLRNNAKCHGIPEYEFGGGKRRKKAEEVSVDE
jgi:hypothetical protein